MYQILVFLHVIAAVTWLGGMLFLLVVMIPLARRNETVGFGALRQAAEKFLPIAWAAKVVLAGSGAYLAWEYWNIRPELFFTGDTHFVQYLQMKTGLFVIVVLLSLAHDFWLGPRMMDRLAEARASGAPLPTGPSRLFVQWAARVNLVLAVWIVAFAIWMTRP